MSRSTIVHFHDKSSSAEKVRHSNWPRIVLLCVLAYEGAGALLGSVLLIIAPDGRLMDMPVEIMHGTFVNFLIPGVILFGLGVLNTTAFFAVVRKWRVASALAAAGMGGMIIWFWIEIAVLLGVHWLHAMWGLPVVLGAIAVIPLIPARHQQTALLSCGFVSSVLFVAVNIIVPAQWEGYSLASRVPSELSAIGAPTRTLWAILASPYTLLMIAFGWGIMKADPENRRLCMAGKFLIAYGMLGFLWPFAPMHTREVLAAGGGTFSDTLHIALGGVTNIFYLLALGYAAAALSRRFRLYSIATFILVLVFGLLTFNDSPGVGRNEPTPLIGVWERINIGIFLIWIAVLSMILLRRHWRDEKQLQTEEGTRSGSLNQTNAAKLAQNFP